MTKKLQTLLDINTIMKRRVELRFAELVNQREAIKSEIGIIKRSIQTKKEALQNQQSTDPFSAHLFLGWVAAQQRKIQSFQAADETLIEQQKPIRTELASIFVRDKTLVSRIKREKSEVRLKTQKNQAEITQSLWLQKKL